MVEGPLSTASAYSICARLRCSTSMSKKSPSWHVIVNSEPHVMVTKTAGDTFWVKDVPETTLATSGAHWVTHSSGSALHFDLYRDKNKWEAVSVRDCIVQRAAVGPEGATFALSGYRAYAVLPIDRKIGNLDHSASSGLVTVRTDVPGQVVVAVYAPPSSDANWQARTRSSGP